MRARGRGWWCGGVGDGMCGKLRKIFYKMGSLGQKRSTLVLLAFENRGSLTSVVGAEYVGVKV